jgi:hypothetical protein
VTCGAVIVAATVRLLEPELPPRSRAVAWTVLGLAAGIGWWSSQIMGMFLVTAILCLVVGQSRAWRTGWPYVAVGLFMLTSSPLWIWNRQHDWATFRHLATWGDGPAPLPLGVSNVTSALVASLRDRYWDGHVIQIPPAARYLGRAVLLTVYAPAVVLAMVQVGIWMRRAWRRERPWQEPLDVVVLAFWLTVAAHLATWFGTSGILRYSITFYVTLPVLCATLLARVARAGPLGRGVAATLAVALLAYNAVTHRVFIEAGRTAPRRPVDALIARLEHLGIRACYADSRIAQVITFESTERILCTDYHGYRNFRLLEAVDLIEDPGAVAIVTHRALQNPHPKVMAETLRFMGVEVQEDMVGDFVIFHRFVPPDSRVHPLPPTGWRARVSSGVAAAALAFDRQAWTRWSAPKRPGEWFELDLGQARPIAQVSLLSAPRPAEAPVGLRVETSLDGQRWDTVATDPDLLPGLHWWKGHPRLDDSGRVIVRFAPREGRYVRLTAIGREWPGGLWSVAELFVYEAVEAPSPPPPTATAALAAAARELDRWMDDPTGPHPLRAPVTSERRRAQVRWGPAFSAVNAALATAPEWEEPHHVYGMALARAGWGHNLEHALDQAGRDGAWLEAIRLAALIDAEPDATWRAGRLATWAEALERLGRSAEAAAIRARPDPMPARAVRVRFGQELELVGVDGPREARPGETVRVSYHWRRGSASTYDYWVFLHVLGLPDTRNPDQPVGAVDYGPSYWAPGERVRQTVTFTVPPAAAPGVYPLRVGVWLPSTGRRLHVLSSDLPQARRAVTIGTLVVVR